MVSNNQPLGFDFDSASDLPGSYDLPAALDSEPTAGDAAPPSQAYGSTDYAQSGYDSTSYSDDASPPSTFDLPPDLGDLPPVDELPPLGDTTQLQSQLELESDLPMPSGMQQGGIMLNDDLPMPTSGAGHDIALDLPAPSSYESEGDESVPQLMDAKPVYDAPPPPADRRETAIVRDKKLKDDFIDEASTEDDIPEAKGKGKGLRYAVAALVIVGGLGVLTFQFPEYVPFALPWAKTEIAENPTPTTATPANPTPGETKTAGTDTTKPLAAPVELPPPTPELTAANVNQLGYLQLRDATKTLAADAKSASGASHELLQWARFRLARYGDQEARDALLADAPQLSPTASELTAAAAVGAQLLQKPMVAKKNAERLVGGVGPANKSRFKDSVAMLIVAAAANEKPPFKAMQIYERILAIDSRAMDARVGKIESQLLMPKPELHEQAIASAISMTKQEPTSAALAVRLGTAAANAGESSAMMDITSALVKTEQVGDVPSSQQAQFAKLLAHRAAIAGDFASAKAAAELAVKNAPMDVVAAQDLARAISAAGKDPESALQETRAAVRDVDGKAQLVDEQVKLAIVRNDVAAAKKAQGLYSDLAPRPAMPFVKLSDARIAQADGKNDAARMAAMQAAKMRPKSFEARLLVINMGKLPPPGELAQLTALAKQANNADVDARLAKAMVDRQNPGGGAELYARALWRDPMPADPIAVVVALTDALDRGSNADRSEAYLTALRDSGSTDPRLGDALMAHAKRFSKGTAALDYFQSASAKNPTDIQAKLQYARALVEADRAGEAQSLLDALAHSPEGKDSPEVLTELARAWISRDSVKARDYVNEAIRTKPDAGKYVLLGEIEESQTKLDDAMDAYRKAVKLDSTNQEARVRLARAQIQRGQWQDASTQLRDIVQHDPTNVQAMELLGDAQRDLGKPRDALLWYKKALDITPDSATLMMKFARLQLQDLSAVQPAVKSFRRVLQVHPEVAEAHYYLGYALKDMGKNGEAKIELEEYLKARPDGEFATEVKNDLQDLASQ